MVKKEDFTEKHNKAVLLDTSFDTEELSVETLMKNGFTPEQATSWLRTMYIEKMFDKCRG